MYALHPENCTVPHNFNANDVLKDFEVLEVPTNGLTNNR